MTVGIDIGTTSVKAVAADEQGRVVARTRVPHRLVVPSPGRLEHDPAIAWWDGPRRALEALGGPTPAAVAVAGLAPSLAAVGGGGRPLAPGILYGDERGRPGVAPGLDDPAHSEEAERLLAWIARHHTGAAGYWPAQAVAYRALGGPAAVDYATAFASGSLFDGGGWDAQRAEECGVRPDQLPAVAMFGERIGDADRALGGVPLVAGGVDAFCEQLVAGAAPGDALVVCGSTLVVWAVGTGWPPRPGVWRLPYVRPGEEVIGGASNAGGLFLDWVDRLVRPADPAEADPAAVPVWWPYVRGERVPLHDPARRAELAGLDLTHDAAALRRAAYEASAFAARHILEASGAVPARLVTTGGGSGAAGWVQALADVTALPVETVAVPEGAALGAAFLARVGVGLEASVDQAGRWAARGPCYEPDPRWRDAVEERYRTYLERLSTTAQ